jgi:hypothetical protein
MLPQSDLGRHDTSTLRRLTRAECLRISITEATLPCDASVTGLMTAPNTGYPKAT